MKIHQDAAVLDAYLDGELTPQTAAQVEAHLAQCPDCRALVEGWMTLRDVLAGQEEAPPPGFAGRVMEAVARYPRKPRPWGKLAAAAACLALIVLMQQGASKISGGDGAVTLYSAAGGGAAPNAAASNAAPEGERQESVMDTAPAPGASAADPREGSGLLTAPPPLDNTAPQQEELPILSLTAPGLGETLETLLPDAVPEESAPGYVRYRLDRQTLGGLFAALEERGIAPPALPETGAVFWLDAYEE